MILNSMQRGTQHRTSPCKIGILLKSNNENQTEWINAVKTYARSKRGLPLLLKQWNRARSIEAWDLNNPSVESIVTTSAKSEPEDSSEVEDGKEHESEQADTKKRKLSVTETTTAYNSIDDLEDLERLILEDETKYIDPRTNRDEDAAQEALRHKMYAEVVKSTPLHRRAHSLCQRGNIYHLISLIMRDITVTATTAMKYIELFTALKLQSGESIIDFINRLEEIRKGALRTKENVITETLLKGKIIMSVTGHSLFKDLAVQFKQKGCNQSYSELCDTLVQYEVENTPLPQSAHSNNTEGTQQHAMMAMMASQLKKIEDQLSPTPSSTREKEECRNYLKGRCKGKCGRIHTPGKEGTWQYQKPQGAAQNMNKKQIKCFYCNEKGYHIARNCPKRQGKRPEQANLIESDDESCEDEEKEHTCDETANAAQDLKNYLSRIRQNASMEQGNSAIAIAAPATTISMYPKYIDPTPHTSYVPSFKTRNKYAATLIANRELAMKAAIDACWDNLPSCGHRILLDSGASSTFLMKEDKDKAMGELRQEKGQVGSANKEDSSLRYNERMDALMSVKTSTETNEQLYLSNACVMEGQLRQRLASLGQMTKDGYAFMFIKEWCYIYRDSKFLTRIKRSTNNLYEWTLNSKTPHDTTDKEAELVAMTLEELHETSPICPELLPTLLNGHSLLADKNSMRKSLATQKVSNKSRDGFRWESTSLHKSRDGFRRKKTSLRSRNRRRDLLDESLGHTSEYLVNDIRECDEALMARVFAGNGNFKLMLHKRFNHASLYKGGPLDKMCADVFGSKYTDSPDFSCNECLTNKVHSLPHKRRTAAEKQLQQGDGAHGIWCLDTFSWPYAGENGEMYGAVLHNGGRQIFPLVAKTKGMIPQLAVDKLEEMKARQKFDHAILNIREIWDPTQVSLPVEADHDKMKTLITDGAKEFMTGPLYEYARKHNIDKIVTSRYTPSQNPAENIVKIATQGICTLMTQFGGPSKFWTRAFRHFCDVYERLPNKGYRGKYKTPIEAFYQKRDPFSRPSEARTPLRLQGIHACPTLTTSTHTCSSKRPAVHLHGRLREQERLRAIP